MLRPFLHSPPTSDPVQLWNFGVAGVSIPQYLRWADDLGVFDVLSDRDVVSVTDVLSSTSLSERGIDAIFGILCSLRLVERIDNRFRLTDVAREYLVKRSPYFIGDALYGMLKRPIPEGFQKGAIPRRFSEITGTFWYWFRFVKRSAIFWGRPTRLLVQHSRNFPAAAKATETTHFCGISSLVDIGGGSGVFAIPLALRFPSLRITLMELPRVVPNVKQFLSPYRVTDQISLVGHDMHKTPWPVQGCDAVLFANILHFCDDNECLNLLREGHRLMPAGGRVILFEMLWNDNKDGPLVTAYWNFWLISVSAGRQRTRAEFEALFLQAGFAEPVVEEVFGGFSLLVAIKP